MQSVKLFGVAVLGLSILGCGGGGEATYPVKGKVTFGGQPALSMTRVHFAPVDPAGETATGIVDTAGNYEVFSGSDGRVGARPGKYKVYFTYVSSSTDYMSNRGNSKAAPKQEDGGIPKAFGSLATTTKEVDVTSGDNTIDLEL